MRSLFRAVLCAAALASFPGAGSLLSHDGHDHGGKFDWILWLSLPLVIIPYALADDLPIDIIDGCRKEQQCNDCPAVISYFFLFWFHRYRLI